MSYRKVDTRIWNDEKFLRLSDDGKMLFFLMLTHPDMTMLGAMKTSPASLADDAAWALKRLEKALAEVTGEGLAVLPDKSRLLILPRFLKYNPPANPNVVKAWGKAFDKLPACEEKEWLADWCKAYVEGLSEPFQKAFPEVMAREAAKASAKGYRKQEQEQKKEPIQVSKNPLVRDSTTPGASAGGPDLKVVA